MNLRNFLYAVAFLFFGSASLGAQEESLSSISLKDVPQIPFTKLNGRTAFIRPDAAPLRVFVFLSPECPLCKNYSLVLNELQKKYESRVRFYGLVPGKAYSAKEVRQYVRDYKIIFPVLIDGSKRFSNAVGATVTPEVVVADGQGNLVYRGAIDDWVESLGRKKIKPQQHYLEQAIALHLNGQPVALKKTVPKGCLINEF